ncbi:MAG: hypothetical protein Q4Q58_06725 [Thermoplasmata archaeon]|nr:hypothetical protein [Thermoplasmata archaeon]
MTLWMLPDGTVIDDDSVSRIIQRAYTPNRFYQEVLAAYNPPDFLSCIADDDIGALYQDYIRTEFLEKPSRVESEFGIVEIG